MKNSLLIKLATTTSLAILTISVVSIYLVHSLTVSIAVAILAAIFSTVSIFIFLKPLQDLIKSAKALGDGNFNQRVDLRTGDEFEEVGNSFNQMANKLSGIFQKLERDTQIAISEKSKLNEVLSSIIDGIIALDFNRNILLANRAAEEITGFTTAELQGQRVDNLIHLFSDFEEILPKTYCETNFSQSAKLTGKEGKQTSVNVMTSKVGEALQTNLSCILIFHDLSKEEELEKMKMDFVSMASHELRTPLTSIIGYLSVFANENRGKLPKQDLDLIEKSEISARQLLTLIQNLLNVNKIEREEMSVTPEPVDYLPILSKAVEDLKTQANQKDIVLNFNPPTESLPKVMADPIRISEVVTNLLANAINYTNPGGKVELIIQVSPDKVTTTISDTGVGIPKDAIPHLFNKFFRVSNQSQKMSKGTGLGLYITKSIIEKLNGKIWVESELGKGSRFCFSLPVATISSGVLNTNQFMGEQIQAGALNY
ncbi:MAG: Multi-sensor signal transduction histidine kinase [Microgenomates group bacterium Gr01-1014_7]|nr:MAG: Multi-sensor signal transduction histidine kinase [Microgenomates group bacterium Gr01-1014_7]